MWSLLGISASTYTHGHKLPLTTWYIDARLIYLLEAIFVDKHSRLWKNINALYNSFKL